MPAERKIRYLTDLQPALRHAPSTTQRRVRPALEVALRGGDDVLAAAHPHWLLQRERQTEAFPAPATPLLLREEVETLLQTLKMLKEQWNHQDVDKYLSLSLPQVEGKG